jgi:signal peptidase I
MGTHREAMSAGPTTSTLTRRSNAPAGPAALAGPAQLPRRRARPDAVVVAAVAVALLVAVRLFVAEPVRVPTASMQPALNPGDHVLVAKLSAPRRGDLVVFTAPRDGTLMVKRIAAVGGDRVGIEHGELVVNGRVAREPYVRHPIPTGAGIYLGPFTVPSDSVFVLGDNRTDSVDSREFGPVRRDAIVGRVVVRLWPDPGPR